MIKSLQTYHMKQNDLVSTLSRYALQYLVFHNSTVNNFSGGNPLDFSAHYHDFITHQYRTQRHDLLVGDVQWCQSTHAKFLRQSELFTFS
jgi:hypothetical protein